MESAGGGNHQPGAQNEPFFDLLQQSAPITSSSSSYNIPKKMENSVDFNFGGDDVLPSFDFQPIRTSAGSSSSITSGSSAGARIEENRGRQGSPPASYTSYEPMVRRSREPPPTYETPVSRSQEYEKESFDSVIAAVERTMKKYADNLLRVLEGMTGRLSQLESSTQRLEHLFGEIKNAVVDTHGEADGKLRSLENHILEVHRGVQVLRDRQEIFEAQSQLAKLQLTSKSDPAHLHNAPSAPPPVAETQSQLLRASCGKALTESPQQQQVSDTPSSSYYQPQPQLELQSVRSLPAPMPPQQQPQLPPQQPPPQQLQHHLPQQQLQQPAQLQQQGVPQSEVSHQTLHHQQPPPPPPPPQQLSQHPPHPPQPPQYSQHQQSPYPQQQQQQQQASQPPIPNYGHPPEAPYNQHPQSPHPGSHHVPSSLGYPPDLPSYHPSYGPRPSLPSQQQPSQMPPGQQQQQPHSSGMYDPSLGRSASGHLSLPAPAYHSQGHSVSGNPHYESQALTPGSGYPGSSYRVAQPVPSAPGGGSGGYPRLPVAQPLPHAIPTSGGATGAPPAGPPMSTNRVPIEEVIDKVTAMGFSKDQVRAVVRRLTENGQSVDLNIVLDKLMNGDSAQVPPKGWFNR